MKMELKYDNNKCISVNLLQFREIIYKAWMYFNELFIIKRIIVSCEKKNIEIRASNFRVLESNFN